VLGSYASELLRLRARPAVWVLLAAWMVLYVLFSYALPYLAYVTGSPNDQTQGIPRPEVLASTLPGQLVVNALGGTPVFAGALALVFGALVAGSEYGWGTWKTLLTRGPSRLGVLAGKLLALVTAALVAMLTTFGVGAAVSAGIAANEGRPLAWPGAADLVQGFAAGWLVITMWCLFGAMLGVTLRGVALPIGLGVVWVLAVENLVSAVAGTLLTALQPVRDLMPGANAGSLVSALTSGVAKGSATPGVTDAVSGTHALVTLGAYALLFAALAAAALRRRDLT